MFLLFAYDLKKEECWGNRYTGTYIPVGYFLGPIHTGRGTGRITGRKQMGAADVSGGVHTALKQHQRENIWICMRIASCVLCGLGLNLYESGASKRTWTPARQFHSFRILRKDAGVIDTGSCGNLMFGVWIRCTKLHMPSSWAISQIDSFPLQDWAWHASSLCYLWAEKGSWSCSKQTTTFFC